MTGNVEWGQLSALQRALAEEKAVTAEAMDDRDTLLTALKEIARLWTTSGYTDELSQALQAGRAAIAEVEEKP